MSHVLRVGVADQIAYFRAYNTDGSAKTDLTSATTGLTLSVFRIGASSVSIASLSNKAADNTAHADGAIRNVGGNLYTIDIPDAATATQVPSIVVRGTYTGGVIEGLEHPIVAYDPSVNYGSNAQSLDIQSRIPTTLDNGNMRSSVQNIAAIADAVWDESLTGASHNSPTSAGRRLRSLADTVILKEGDTVAADNAGTIGGSNNLGRIQLQPDVGTACIGQAIRVAGQVRFIEAYDAGTQYATVDNSWCTIPSPGDEYSIFSQRTSLIQKITSAAVGTIAYPIAKLWEMIEDVSGWRFKEKALEEVPTSSVTITPLSSEVEQRVDGTNITVFLGENITVGPIVVTDSNGNAVDLSATCEIVISRKFRGDILIIPNSSITRSGVGNNQFTFPSTGATLIVGTHAWALRRVSDNFVYSYGDWIVKQAATKD